MLRRPSNETSIEGAAQGARRMRLALKAPRHLRKEGKPDAFQSQRPRTPSIPAHSRAQATAWHDNCDSEDMALVRFDDGEQVAFIIDDGN